MRNVKFYLLIVALLTLAVVVPMSAQVSTITLPASFVPEGTVIPFGHTLYVSSQANGSIYVADLLTGDGSELVPPNGRIALGLSYDSRTNYLFVAGGPSFPLRIYNAGTGDLVREYSRPVGAETDCPGFVNPAYFANDVVVTSRGAYVSDSLNPCIYKAALGPSGGLPEELDIIALERDGLPGDGWYPSFCPNGIEASSNGKQLFLVDTAGGGLYSINPDDGGWIRLLDNLVGGDGLLLIGRRLYVAQNFLNQVSVVELKQGTGKAELVHTIRDPSLDSPATLAAFGPYLYVANAGAGGLNVSRLRR